MTAEANSAALAKLREPFAPHHISKLPKPTKAQTDAVKADYKVGIRCQVCGGWHHKDVVHLDYVGHAALTDRLLDTDPHWYWEPMATHEGLPAFDHSGGLWIRLTVCGMTRLGYGHAAPKPGQDPGAREKEVIGDALRNAAMRFGAALDLWHKGDLHADDETPSAPKKDYGPAALADDFQGAEGKGKSAYAAKKDGTDKRFNELRAEIATLEGLGACTAWANARADEIKEMPESWRKELRGELENQRAFISEAEARG